MSKLDALTYGLPHSESVLTMVHLLLALDFVAPMIGGVVLAGAVSFFGGVLLAKKEATEQAPLDERQLRGLENEIQRLNRERIATRFEDQVLKEFFGHSDLSCALSDFLKQLCSAPFCRIRSDCRDRKNSQFLIAERGLSPSSVQRLSIPSGLFQSLKVQRQIIVRPESDETGLYQFFDAIDRYKALQLYLTAFEQGDEIFAVLITSSPWPPGLTEPEQLAFTKRVVRLISERWQQLRVVEKQSKELRTTQIMLELKSIVATPSRGTSRDFATIRHPTL